MAEADVSPCRTVHPRASNGSLAGRRSGTGSRVCGGEVAISTILTRLPDPGHAVRLQDCKVSTFGRALHRLDQVQAAWRAAARHWWQSAKVAKSRGFTSLPGGHVVWSTCNKCDFSVLSGHGVLYYVPIACTNTARRLNIFSSF